MTPLCCHARTGVAFGAIGTAPGATFGSAVSLALGIGIQNFPEGLAVSMPLMREGVSPLKAFWYGQLSGLVEPVGGTLRSECPRCASLTTEKCPHAVEEIPRSAHPTLARV